MNPIGLMIFTMFMLIVVVPVAAIFGLTPNTIPNFFGRIGGALRRISKWSGMIFTTRTPKGRW
jgi:hypothetical protein